MKNRLRFKPVPLLVLVCWLLTCTGAMALVLSIIYNSSVLAFIGLGLTLWGVIVLYIRPEACVKEALLSATVLPAIENQNQLIKALGCKGKGIYLPPQYLKLSGSSKVYISAQEDMETPSPEQLKSQEEGVFLKNPEGILISPPGAELASLFEKKMGTGFITVDFRYLEKNMPRLLVEDLEIARNVEMRSQNGRVHVKMENSIFANIHKEAKLSQIYGSLGCPLCSAIACTLARATGRPVIIERDEISEDGKITDVEYRLLEEPKEKTR